MSANISMKSLLESGVHFGHRTNKWNPAMKPYIFTERNGIHIIDLQQTVKFLEEGYNAVRDLVADGGKVLFVGTKRQAQESVKEQAERCGMPYVIERWLPGTLTNWSTIYQRILELQTLESNLESGKYEKLVKKEVLMINRRINKLNRDLGGIRELTDLPQMLYVVDIMREYTAVHEANLKGIPVIAMVDTNCNPDSIDYLIPANDDAIRAIKLLVTKVADAVLEGKAMRKEEEELEEASRLEGADAGMDSTQSLLDEEEVSDEDLLGASTLAKISSKKEEELDEEFDDDEESEEEVKEAAKKKTKKAEDDSDEDEEEVEEKKPAKKKSEEK